MSLYKRLSSSGQCSQHAVASRSNASFGAPYASGLLCCRCRCFVGFCCSTLPLQADALVRDLLFSGTFDAQLGDDLFLSAAERSHLVDVGLLFRGLALFGAGALALLSLLAIRRRRWVLQGIRDGAVLLGAGAALVGGAFLFAFDATFTAAHQLLFPAGTWTFNPATDRLVQLYPETFWVAAAIGFCAVLVVTAAAGFRVARRRRR